MMMKSKQIKDTCIGLIGSVSLLESSIRDHINTHRYQTTLLKNINNWNQICSSLDVLGDTLYAVQDYLEADYPSSAGLKYIYTYGLLQVLFVQQDAIEHLFEAFDIRFTRSEKLKAIREKRNASIGHPTKQKGGKYYNHISRMTLSKSGFTLMKCSQQNIEFIDINIYSELLNQLYEIEKNCCEIAGKLERVDKMHLENFKNSLLEDVFDSSMGYAFEKVAQGIYSPDSSNVDFALNMLEMIKANYECFENALSDRNELDECTKFDLGQYIHAINKIKNYFSDEGGSLSEEDARTYHFYIQERHKHFVELAMEIDTKYKK